MILFQNLSTDEIICLFPDVMRMTLWYNKVAVNPVIAVLYIHISIDTKLSFVWDLN
jgi:hypothetical protein